MNKFLLAVVIGAGMVIGREVGMYLAPFILALLF